MIKSVFVLLLFIPVVCLASRPGDTLDVGRISKTGIQLDKHWKFRAGDNPDFARQDFDDRDWQQINPALAKPTMPVAAQSGTGWLRLSMRVGKSAGSRIILLVRRNVPMEFYFNGKLIAKGDSASLISAVNPIDLPLSGNQTDVLAVRFTHPLKRLSYNEYLDVPLLSAWLTNSEQVVYMDDQQTAFSGAMIFCAAMLILMGILHTTFLLFNPSQKANLFFALYTLCIGAAFLAFGTSWDLVPTPFWVANIVTINMLLYTGILLSVKAMYALFGFKTGWYFRIMLFTCVVAVFLGMVTNWLNGSMDMVGMVLVVGTLLTLAVKAVILKKRGSLIVAAGFGVAILSLLIYIVYLVDFNNLGASMTWAIVILIILVFLSPPLSISIFLARELALDSRMLQVKLKQVEELSAANLAQEQEKQHLLASQNELLERQVADRTEALNRSLNDLRQTQAQLIQSEKMASLGELTAGIAHEIQNPLNFVNNFSEVSRELLGELKEELAAGNMNDVLAITGDLDQNLEKIHHHGRRADGIVKGMLQHSRTGSGRKEPTDINALAGEYWRLSYHGWRAKDAVFNAELTVDLDAGLPKINVVPQDIGRALLNLFNNALQAMQERQRQAGPDYIPQVMVKTASAKGGVEIYIRDNGTGIPEKIKDKIFQPFFTTRPAGEGTGLGLSLSYDIVVKGHGGTLEVLKENVQGTVFRVWIPGSGPA